MPKAPDDKAGDETPKRVLKAPPNPHADKGKASRADQHKGRQQKPAKQRIQRHQGR